METESTLLIVNITLWVLALFSILTWTLIFYKTWQFIVNANNDKRSQAIIWAASSIAQAEKQIATVSNGSVKRLFDCALAFNASWQSSLTRTLAQAGCYEVQLEKALKIQLRMESQRLESGLTILASIGTTSPFVGLFGTVWGIMRALQDISVSGKASLDVVAGPIGEALIATAIGIAVAVPAVLAYNFLIRQVRHQRAMLEAFTSELHDLLILQFTGDK